MRLDEIQKASEQRIDIYLNPTSAKALNKYYGQHELVKKDVPRKGLPKYLSRLRRSYGVEDIDFEYFPAGTDPHN